MPRSNVPPRDPITREEAGGMVENARCDRDRALVSCLYLTGARISEILGLQNSDIKTSEDGFSVQIRSLKRHEGGPLIHRHTLHFPMTAPFADVFLNYSKSRAGLGEDGYVFPGDHKDRMCRQRGWFIVKSLNPLTYPHLFRHSRLTMLARVGADPWELRDWAGRKTVPYEYVQPNPSRLRALGRKVS